MGIETQGWMLMVNWLFCGEEAALPDALYLGWLDADGEELDAEGRVAPGYERTPIPRARHFWRATPGPNGTGCVLANAVGLIGAAAERDWPEVHGWALYDAQSGGNCLAKGDVYEPAPIPAGSGASFPAGHMELFLDVGKDE